MRAGWISKGGLREPEDLTHALIFMISNFLKGQSCIDVIRYEFSWQFVFGKGCSLTVWCPWRIVSGGRIAVAHTDHEQQFGLPMPVDVVAKAIALLSNSKVLNATARQDTSDLTIDFDDDVRLELFTDSSGYEAWQLEDSDRICVGRNQ